MNILVTGGRGFIGSLLIRSLLEKQHTVWSYDLHDNLDILNTHTLEKQIQKVDTVYHLAALTDVQESLVHPSSYYAVNVMGTLNVVLACKKYKKKCIYTSTAAVYDPYSSPYAHTKKIAEQIVQSYLPSAVTLRLFNVYGYGMKESTMIDRFLRESPVTIYGNGKQTRDFIHIWDVVSVLTTSLYPRFTGFCGDVGTGNARSVLSIAKKMGKAIRFEKERQEVKESTANIRLLRKLYKKPFLSLDTYIDKYKGL